MLVHGYIQEMAVWHYQRRALAADGDVRLVLYDHRSHGRSGRGPAERSTIEQLGRDLGTVLDAVAPDGPVVLVGHSMGGMTVMALADARPELFGDRVVGVALVGTSAGKLAQLTFGLPTATLPVTRRVLPLLTKGMTTRPRPFERGRRAGSDLAFLLTRRGGFGSGDVSPAVVEFVATMAARTPVDVIAEYYDTFMSHDKLAALDVLRPVRGAGRRRCPGPHDAARPQPGHRRRAARRAAGRRRGRRAHGGARAARPGHRRAARPAAPRPRARGGRVSDRSGVSAPGWPPPSSEAAQVVGSSAQACLELGALATAAQGCTACPELAATRRRVVPGVVPPGARLLVMGEAPGAQEDESGRPFVGRSGQLLDELLAEVGVDRADVGVLNTVKCRPPGNRPPTRPESAACRGWTERQLQLAAPSVVVALGLSATRWFLGPGTLSSLRGRLHPLEGGPVPGLRVLPTYHPSAAIRHGPAGEPRRLLREDLALAVRALA